MISAFISAFVAMFVIVDPLGTAAVFAVLTGHFSKEQARATAVKAVLIAIGVLVGFSLIGEALLHHMGISLHAFRIAGGFLLFVTAFRMLMGSHDASHLNSEETSYADRSNVAIFPLAIPFLAGPGCMTAALLNVSNTHLPAEKISVLAAIVLVEVLALICMFAANKIVRAIGPDGTSLLARLMGILLAAMGVQFIADGVLKIIS